MAEMRRLQDNEPREPFQITWPSIQVDPLWQVFKLGIPTDDPYNALLIAMDAAGHAEAVADNREEKWLKSNRWRGKKAFLAFAYGASAETLAPSLKWSISRTQEAIRNIEDTYVTLQPLRNLTMLNVVHFGEVHTLWGRPRRVNGYFQLAQSKPMTVGFYRMRPTYRSYVGASYRWAPRHRPRCPRQPGGGGGIQAFVEQCWVELDDGKHGEVILAGNPNGTLAHISRSDPFANALHFNKPPFRNINFNHVRWVEDEHGLKRMLPRQGRALRGIQLIMSEHWCGSPPVDHELARRRSLH